jgi:hypothetical protein
LAVEAGPLAEGVNGTPFREVLVLAGPDAEQAIDAQVVDSRGSAVDP